MVDVKDLESEITTALVNSHPPGVKKYRNSLEQYKGHAKIAANVMLGRGVERKVAGELLEALEVVVEIAARNEDAPAIQDARAVIAKAKGEA